jgi:hypothetical protein
LIGFLGLCLTAATLASAGVRVSARKELWLHYQVVTCVLILTAIHPFLPHNEVFAPAAKVWSAESIKSFAQDYSAPGRGGYLSMSSSFGTPSVPADRVLWAGSLLAYGQGIFWLFLFGRSLWYLSQIKRTSHQIKKLGRVRIFVNGSIQVPFSFWWPGQANVILPASMIERPKAMKMALAHELQHHRQGDTCWVYVLYWLRVLCLINPALFFWNRWISEIQEFACDETLVEQKKVEPQAYARCLIEVAQLALNQKRIPECATGFTFSIERNNLTRRIEKMFAKSTRTVGRTLVVAVACGIVSLMVGMTVAAKGLVQDRRVTLGQARTMAAKIQSESGFPIVINDLVLKQLNRYIGTPEGREFMRESLTRMDAYKATVGSFLQKYNVPMELMALPLIESGYRNLTESQGNYMKTAGLWQFIPSTARNFGLRIDATKDERLDIGIGTDAAMRLLLSTKLRFGDWPLAVLAYNMGDQNVQKAMNALGTRDAWTLIRNGFEGDKDYLPKLIAAILIMKSPESVE